MELNTLDQRESDSVISHRLVELLSFALRWSRLRFIQYIQYFINVLIFLRVFFSLLLHCFFILHILEAFWMK